MTRPGALVTVLLLCGLAACEDEPVPDIPDPTPSSSSPTVTESTSTPTESSEPPVALTPEETVRAWVAARNQALQNGDTGEVDALSDAGCKTCENSLDPVREVYEQGGYYDTQGWTVSSVKRREDQGDLAVVTAGVTYEAGATVPAAGETAVEYQAERHLLEFRLVEDGESWLVAFIGTIS